MKRIGDIGGMFPFKVHVPGFSGSELIKVWSPFMGSLNDFDPYNTMKLWVCYTSPSISMGGIIYSNATIGLRL